MLNTVSNNNAPDDPTDSFEQRDQYIERSYITLLGRKPDSAEHSAGRVIIDEDPRDSTLRYLWLSSVVSNRAASVKRWDDIRSELLESVDTLQIAEAILALELTLPGLPPLQQQLIQEEIDDLYRILYVPDSLYASSYSNLDVHKYSVDNLIYDDINMGAENFVVSVFDHFLYRYPTQYDLDASKNMVDGFRDVLFLQSGEGKQDFINIFFNSDGYAEGQIRYAYLNYLFREPSSSEMQTEMMRFALDRNFIELQIRVLSTDDFFFQ